MRVIVLVLVALLLAAPATAQTPLPLAVELKYTQTSQRVGVTGTTRPGTVVAVAGALAHANGDGQFVLNGTLPISLVAVSDGQTRRLRLDLPQGATKYLEWLNVELDLTKMTAVVTGALTIKSHPAATVIVHHVEANSAVRGSVRQGNFDLTLPLVRGTNTLEWALQVGFLRFPAPDFTFTVD
ncbi:MAG TPA: hypothetical protein VGK88_08590 [bacterium]|jgi:hypothetical protein